MDSKCFESLNFVWFVTFHNITYVKPRLNDCLICMKTFDVIVTPYALWPIITYGNIIGNDIL